ncbi:MAG TPA: FMN-binding protein [Clostridiales bacterium]|nr:FMN-binding protein [Clostridiales bacterium]
MNKRISLITAFVMVLILLAACAPQPSQPQATPTPAPAETTPEPTPTDDNAGNQGEDDTGNVTTAEGLEDGVYVGKSDEDERGSYGEIRITVADEQFTKVEYTEYSGDGNPKSRETGYEYEEALEAFEELPKQLMETQDVDDIDDYTGATGTSNKFRTAAKRALSGSPEEGQPAQDNGANENGGVEDDNGVREEDGGTGES